MFTPITLDKVRNFKYGMKAISNIEKKLKVKIGQLDFDNLDMEQIATVIWAGLVHEDNKLTPDKIMDLVDDHSNLQTVLKVMTEALAEGFGAGGEVDEKN